jgi:uncharacterized protein involved in type VI secretion and phage assembly
VSDGLAPALVLGTVVQTQSSIDGLKVRLQRLDRPSGTETDWVQVASPMAGEEAGFSFMPRDGDLAVAALHGQVPVVLGFLYGGGVTPPTGDPDERLVQSRDGNALVLVDGKDSGITLRDKHGNEIKMDAQGISITTPGRLLLEATGTTTVKGSVVELNP